MALRKLFVSALWLALIQFLNIVLPVMTVPIVTRAFGPTMFGVLATISALAGYVGLLATFGFNLTGPRATAVLRDELSKLSTVISNILSAQAALAATGTLVFVSAAFFISDTSNHKTIAILILIQVVANSMMPQWAFLGMDRLRDATIIQAIFRIAASTLIIVFVRSDHDILLYVAINAGSSIAIAISSLILLRLYGIRLSIPTVGDVIATIKSATALFTSALAINLYTTTNVVIVNMVLGPTAAGPFALADRLRQATSGLLGPITGAIYPFVCRIAEGEETTEEAKTKRLFFRTIFGLSFLMSIGLFTFAPTIVQLAGGGAFADAASVLRITAFVPALTALSNIIAVQSMLPLGMDREVTTIVTVAAVLGVAGMIVMTKMYGLIGAATVVVGVEIFVTAAAAITMNRRRSIFSLFI
jgi:PST family polysaccharide transporter